MKGLLYVIGLADVLFGVCCVWNSGRWEEAVTVFLFYVILTVITFLDINKMEIPDGYSAAMGILAVISVFSMPQVSLPSRIIGIFSISVPMLMLAMAIQGAFGGGDIKLMVGGGFFLGWKLTLLSAIVALLAAGVYSILLLLNGKGKRKDSFPFGPFLCLGMAIALPFGQSIIEWYMFG